MKYDFRPHFKFRAKQREIDSNLAVKIYKKPVREFWDTLRKHNIAIGTIEANKVRRHLMVAYDKIDQRIEFITMHFIREKEIENKIKSGRWKDEKN